MPEISAATPEEAEVAFRRSVEARAAIAFAANCRLAVRVLCAIRIGPVIITYEFIVLSPGEKPEGRGWEIYKNHGGVAVGRSM